MEEQEQEVRQEGGGWATWGVPSLLPTPTSSLGQAMKAAENMTAVPTSPVTTDQPARVRAPNRNLRRIQGARGGNTS